MSKRMSGKKNTNYKDGRTPKSRLERNTSENKQFIKDILKRDNYTCQICDKRGGKLAADHIMPWSLFEKLRQNPENARTLCEPCHKKYGANPYRKPIKWATSPM
jgi:5-methylcytosine-specific restriction endonuclease McrA